MGFKVGARKTWGTGAYKVWGLAGGAAAAASPTYVSEVTADTPVFWWRLGESSGTNAVDASGNGHNGTYSGTVTLGATGALASDANKAMAVAGAGTVGLAAALDLTALNKVTVEFWLKWTAFANDNAMALEFTGDGGATPGGFFVLPNAGAGTWEMRMEGNSVNFSRPSAGVYHHVVAEFDRTVTAAAGSCKLWLDGVAQTPTGTSGGALGGTFANSGLLAMSRAGSALFATGSIDEVALYSGLLSQGRITAHYTAGIT